MLSAIRESAEPLKTKQLAKLSGLKQPQITELLGGEAFNWGTEKGPAYWHKSPLETARERILGAASQGAFTLAELKKAAAALKPKLKPADLAAALNGLENERRLQRVGKQLLDAPHLDAWLEGQIADLLKTWGREQPASRIRALLGDAPVSPSPSLPSVAEAAERVFAAMHRIAFAPGATVTFYRLRQQPELASIPKKIFDEAALLLQKERKALLTPHGHASALPEEERERFVTDGLGTYYVSVYAR